MTLIDLRRPLIIIESPYAASDDTGKGTNVSFARRVCVWAIKNGYTPFASHLFFPQLLDDLDKRERRLGIEMGFQLGEPAKEIWFCTFKGKAHSPGMIRAFTHWTRVASKSDLVIVFMVFNQSGQLVSRKTVWPKEEE